jgi:hypothetical protein
MKKTIEKIDPIANDLPSRWEQKRGEADELEGQITDRIHYILNFIFDFESAKLSTWYFDGAAEGEVGNLRNHISGDTIYSIVTECNGGI